MTTRPVPALLGLALLSACASTPKPAAPVPISIVGLERVMGKNADALVSLFGEADLDIREGTARKLQFTGVPCVLDAYLYPPQAGAVPVVTYVDARTPAGADFDRASCVAALSRRQQAR